MILQVSLLVTLVALVDCIPLPPPPAKRKRGKPQFYSDRLFLKALVIMIVRHLHTSHELLTVLAQPTAEMAQLRGLLTEQGRYPTRRTWERRLKGLPASLPAQINCLGGYLVTWLQPWADCGRAAAIDSTVLRAKGGVWHKKDREAGVVPHSSIDTQAHWTKSGWHGWVYGWKLHLVVTVAAVWIPLAAELTTGALVIKKIKESGKQISMLVTNHNGTFTKKAVGKITFTCTDGHLIDEALNRTIETGEGQTILLKSVGVNENNEQVSAYEFEWSVKIKSKK